jgi:uncharacterized protein
VQLLRVGLGVVLLSLSLAAPVAAGPFEDGLAAAKRGDYATALQLWRPLAEQGRAGAQYNLGLLYRAGRGVPQDYPTAAAWFRKAADQGLVNAQSDLGVMYENGLGGLPRDFTEALNWFRKAADQGDAIAQGNIADMYKNGRGVPRDFAEAANWYRKAAEQGYAPAQYNLGLLYTNGQGVPQDYVQAHMWFSLSDIASDRDSEINSLARNHRAEIEAKMTTEQIAQAQALAAAWVPAWAK